MGKTVDELEEHFKHYSIITVKQWQIRLNPVTKNNIREFLKWTKDRMRLGEFPYQVQLTIADANELIQRQKTHASHIRKTKISSKNATPAQFTSKFKWID